MQYHRAEPLLRSRPIGCIYSLMAMKLDTTSSTPAYFCQPVLMTLSWTALQTSKSLLPFVQRLTSKSGYLSMQICSLYNDEQGSTSISRIETRTSGSNVSTLLPFLYPCASSLYFFRPYYAYSSTTPSQGPDIT